MSDLPSEEEKKKLLKAIRGKLAARERLHKIIERDKRIAKLRKIDIKQVQLAALTEDETKLKIYAVKETKKILKKKRRK